MLNGTANMMTAPSTHNSSNLYSDLAWQFMPLWQDGLGRKRYIEGPVQDDNGQRRGSSVLLLKIISPSTAERLLHFGTALLSAAIWAWQRCMPG